MELMTMTMVQQHNSQQYFSNADGDYKLSPNSNFAFDNKSPNSITIKQEEIFSFSNLDVTENGQAAMRKLVNKLGGTYCSGKPLSLVTRRQIVAMAETGMKACDISRQLQISHGCVSKIIAKWRATGSFEPRRIGGSKPKKTIGDVVAAVRIYKRTSPSIRSLEIRRRLLEDGVCTECNVPSLSSINRIIRMKLRDDLAEFEASTVRDLMAILSSNNVPPSPDEQIKCKPSIKLEDQTSLISSCVQSPELPPQDQPSPPAYIAQIRDVQQSDRNTTFNYNFTHFETKMHPLPSPQPSYPSTPINNTDDKTFNQFQSGATISKIRSNRNCSTTSIGSTGSNSSSSTCTDTSFEINPWQDEFVYSNNRQIIQFGQQNLNYSNLFENFNYQDNDLWALLDELP